MPEQKNHNDDRPFTTAEAADFLRISKTTMLKLLKENKIKAIKVGRDWRITRAALDAFLSGDMDPQK